MSTSVPSLYTNMARNPTLADVLERLDAATPKTQSHRNLESSVRKLCGVIGRDAGQVRLCSSELKTAFQYETWGAYGLTRQHWANVRSNVKRAIRLSGYNDAPKLSRIPLSEEWASLIATVPQPVPKSMLCRLGRFCSGQHIPPQDVDDTSLEAFFQDLSDIQLSKSPERITRDTARYWNKHIFPTGGMQELSTRSKRDYYGLPWDAFPASLLMDANEFHDRSLTANFMDDSIRLVRPATAAQRHRQLIRLASAEVCGGVPAGDITDLSALVQPECLKKGMEYLLTRNNGSHNQHMYDLLILAQTIGTHWADLETVKLQEISIWAKKIKPNKSGMTERNRERMEPLKDPVIRDRLYELPKRLTKSALKMPPTYASAMKLQVGITIGILLNAPIRLQNLRTLDWGQHFAKRHMTDGRKLFLTLPDHEVKNTIDIELPLPDWIAIVIERYAADYLPQITGQAETTCLFPGPTGVPKSESGTRSLIMRTIKRELGLNINPHLFRHIAAFMFLDKYPGHYETVRKLLGHKNIQTTLNFYTGIEDEAAIAMFGKLIEDIDKGNK